MTKIIKILGQADRVDLIRHITKQRVSTGRLYAPPFSSVSLESLNQLARDVFELAGHPAEHVTVQYSDTIDSYSANIEGDSRSTILINEATPEQSPFMALHFTVIASLTILLRRYGPHRYSQEQEVIIAAHASILLGFGAIGLNAYHEHKPKNVAVKPDIIVSTDKYIEWFNDYIDRHQLRSTVASHLVPSARKTLQLNSHKSESSDPLLVSFASIQKAKRQKQLSIIIASALTLVVLFASWSHIPKPLDESQLQQLQQIEQASQAYEICRDELTTMSRVAQQDIMASRSLQAKYRSCESIRHDHNQMVRELQAD